MSTNSELSNSALQLADQWQDSFLQAKNATQNQAINALAIEAYAITVLGQPNITVRDPSFKTFVDQANACLSLAKSHANDYLYNIHADIIYQIVYLKQFCIYIQSVGNSISQGQLSEKDIPEILTALGNIQSEAANYQEKSREIEQTLSGFLHDIGNDASRFVSIAEEFQNKMTRNRSKLAELNKQLEQVMQQINLDIQQQVKAAIAIKEGIIQIKLGAVGKLFNLNSATPLLLGSISLMAAGVAEEKELQTDLETQLKEKNNLLTAIYNIQKELSQVQGISQGFAALAIKALNAQTAAKGMVDSWSHLIAGLAELLETTHTLDNESTFKLMVQLFSRAFLNNVRDVVDSVTQIENQMRDLHSQAHAMLMGMPNWVATQLGQGLGSLQINYYQPVYALS